MKGNPTLIAENYSGEEQYSGSMNRVVCPGSQKKNCSLKRQLEYKVTSLRILPTDAICVKRPRTHQFVPNLASVIWSCFLLHGEHQDHPSWYPLHLQSSHQDNSSTECLKTPRSCQAQFLPASQIYQIYIVYIGDNHTQDYSFKIRSSCST